jgi:formate hydrogenlyase subunit 3/multisubunit Na+/H+ antiporter MnhD subunit
MSELFYPVLIPMAAGLLVLLIPDVLKGVKELIALAAVVAAAVFAARLLFVPGIGTTFSLDWFNVSDGAFHFIGSIDLRLDGLSRFILFCTPIFGGLVTLYSWGFMKDMPRRRGYYFYTLWAIGASCLALMSDNLLLLLVAWEIVTACLFFLITIGGDKARESAGKTFVILGLSDCAILLGIVLVWAQTGTLTMSKISLGMGGALPVISYLLLLTGAFAKAGVMPFHSWIPKSAEGAPVPVMALLPSSLDKLLGIYLLARLSLDMFALSEAMKIILMGMGGLTVLAAVMMALVQHDLKKLLSFHMVSQVGYMVLGIGTGTPIGIIGGLFHMVNNATYKSCLFLCAGNVEKQAKTTDLSKLGGLARAMPVTFITCFIAAMAISGVPPLNGFVSKWMIYQGAIEVKSYIFLLAALFGSALTLASFIKVIFSVFLGRRPEEMPRVKEVGLSMTLPVIVLAAVCVVLGVVPQLAWNSLLAPVEGLKHLPVGVTEQIVQPGALWSPSLATILIIIGIFLGAFFYLVGHVKKHARVVPQFLGGEVIPPEEARVPGTDFYETIQSMGALKGIYADAEKGVYDIYWLGGRYGQKVVNVGRNIHNGVLSTYLAFCVFGLLILIYVLLVQFL